MVVIEKKKGESIDMLLKRFSKTTKDENILFDVTKKKFYLRPSLMRKEKKRDRLKRLAQQRVRAKR